MSYYIEHCDWMGDWFALRPHQGTSVEGPAEEWLSAANALDGLTEAPHFKRLALRLLKGHWELWSPRNAHGDGDYVYVSTKDGPALAAQIRACVGSVAFAAWEAQWDGEWDDEPATRPREAP